MSRPLPRLEPFRPRFPWANRHIQTISRALLHTKARMEWESVRLATSHGDSLRVDCCPSQGPARRRVLFLHGITGCSNAPPTPQAARELSFYGVESWAINLRGADREVPSIPRLYHAGCSEDLDAVFRQLPMDLPWSFVGYSMGANLLLKWLGEEDGARLSGSRALAISCPFDLAEVSWNLEKTPINRLYRRYMIHRLGTIVKPFASCFPEELSLATIRACRTFPDFDDKITAPLHGFQNAREYWDKCSSSRFLEMIEIPTTLLHSLDDPFQPKPPTHTKNPNLEWEIYPHGGHVGFFQSGRRDWLAKRILRFVLE